MRAVLQRVSAAQVAVDGTIVGAIDRGLLAYVGIARGDQPPQAEWLARRIADLRLFPAEGVSPDRPSPEQASPDRPSPDSASPDSAAPGDPPDPTPKPWDLTVTDVGGAVLLISQFTLLADARKGRRPSFTEAAAPQDAEPLFEMVATGLRERGVTVATGHFGAQMLVSSTNDGPVTITLDRPPPLATGG